jgi:hypothetical protein
MPARASRSRATSRADRLRGARPDPARSPRPAGTVVARSRVAAGRGGDLPHSRAGGRAQSM